MGSWRFIIKAELGIMQLYGTFDELDDSFRADLVRRQQPQIGMLERLVSAPARKA
jgi:hypothetical protein